MLSYLPLLFIAIPYLITAIFGFLKSGIRPKNLGIFSEACALMSLILAIACASTLIFLGASTSPLLGLVGMGFSLRLDEVSAIMLVLVTFIGWVVIRYAGTYLDGEARQGPFTAWLCLTLAAVAMLICAGNVFQLVVAWVATSAFLHRLLLFYPNRAGAQRAARKKFVTARLGDFALVVAALNLFAAYGTGDIGAILAAARGGEGGSAALWASGFLALAAILKSAQFPTHGWLTEVMETPTPV